MIENILVLKGTIALQSPALIGCGKDDHTDIDLIKDSKGNPYIPATSLVGVLRDFIRPSEISKDSFDEFWGYSVEDDSYQSAIFCDDLKAVKSDNQPLIEIRDGIAIDAKKGIVKNGSKYDYEIIKKGTKFSLYIEVRCKEGQKDIYGPLLKTIQECLKEGLIRVGAKTNSGFGRLKLMDDTIYTFDFKDKNDVLLWLKQEYSSKKPAEGLSPFKVKSNDFIIEASLKLKHSLIIRSYPSQPEDPDAVHITSADDYVIPGSSLKGAIRSRALRIVNTLNKPHSIIEDLFGYVSEGREIDKKKRDASKGRIIVDEVVLPKFISELQSRIKIDRFTGGTVASALFESKPIFSSGKEEIKQIKITIKDYKPHEAGLMLFVLKDLFTADLALGGEKSIGRGVFEGLSAEIRYDNQRISFENNPSKLDKDKIDALNSLANALVNY